MLHEPTSPPVGPEREAEKDVKTKQGIQLPSAFVRLNVLASVTLECSVLSCCGNMHMHIPSTTLT